MGRYLPVVWVSASFLDSHSWCSIIMMMSVAPRTSGTKAQKLGKPDPVTVMYVCILYSNKKHVRLTPLCMWTEQTKSKVEQNKCD